MSVEVRVGQRWRSKLTASLTVMNIDTKYAPRTVWFDTGTWADADRMVTNADYVLLEDVPAPAPAVVWQASLDGKTWCDMPRETALTYSHCRQKITSQDFPATAVAVPARDSIAALRAQVADLTAALASSRRQIEAITQDRRALADAFTGSSVARLPGRKQPEPWRPSVDEFDLLPDAGR